MIDINLTKNILVLEKDKKKLTSAIKIAHKEARNALKNYYLPDLNSVPDLTVSIGKGIRNKVQIAIHLLDSEDKIIGPDYFQHIDSLLSVASRCIVPAKIRKKLCLGNNLKLKRWGEGCQNLARIKTGFRLFLMSLLRMKCILLPPMPEKYMPALYNSKIIGADILPQKVIDIGALHYEDLAGRFDWTKCKYVHNYRENIVRGADKIAHGGRRNLLKVALCTNWEQMNDVTIDKINSLHSLVKFNCISQYLTYIYLKDGGKEDFARYFNLVKSVPRLKLYVPEYDRWRKQVNDSNRSSRRTNTKNRPQSEPFRVLLSNAINKSIVKGSIDGIQLAKELHSIPRKPSWSDASAWPKSIELKNNIELNLEITELLETGI